MVNTRLLLTRFLPPPPTWLLQEAIMDTMDHKHLDLDVPYFKDVVR